MTFTSDTQLHAEGLYPVMHLPLNSGFRFIGRTRDGRDVEFTIVMHPLIADMRLSATDGEPYELYDIVGWKHA